MQGTAIITESDCLKCERLYQYLDYAYTKRLGIKSFTCKCHVVLVIAYK